MYVVHTLHDQVDFFFVKTLGDVTPPTRQRFSANQNPRIKKLTNKTTAGIYSSRAFLLSGHESSHRLQKKHMYVFGLIIPTCETGGKSSNIPPPSKSCGVLQPQPSPLATHTHTHTPQAGGATLFYRNLTVKFPKHLKPTKNKQKLAGRQAKASERDGTQ